MRGFGCGRAVVFGLLCRSFGRHGELEISLTRPLSQAIGVSAAVLVQPDGLRGDRARILGLLERRDVSHLQLRRSQPLSVHNDSVIWHL